MRLEIENSEEIPKTQPESQPESGVEDWLGQTLKAAGYEPPGQAPLDEIFKDGVVLAKLISHLTGQKVKVKNKASMIPVQLDNLWVCCQRSFEVT